MKLIFSIFMIFTACISSGQYASESKLAKGNWGKVCVGAEGVFKIDFRTFSQLGLSSINADQIQVFGREGGNLPQPNATSRPDDLNEIPVEIVNDGSNVFGSNDFVIFYSEGPNKVRMNKNSELIHEINYYSTDACYFITANQETGKRIQVGEKGSNKDSIETSAWSYSYIEENKYNVLQSGREWYGDKLSNKQTVSYNFSIDAFDKNQKMLLSLNAMAMSEGKSSSLDVTINKIKETSLSIAAATDSEYGKKGIEATKIYTLDPINSIKIDLKYQATLSNGVAYVDNLALSYKNDMSSQVNQSIVYKNGFDNTYLLKAKSKMKVWDLTNPLTPKVQELGNDLVFGNGRDTIQKYIVFSHALLQSATFIEKLKNQNLHALSTTDFLIITHSTFINEAKTFAKYREEKSGLSTTVVDVNDIYNEFSHGTQDLTAIRDFVRMLYKRSDQDTLKYVLLFGDASYDPLARTRTNTNFIPIYESRQSLDNVNSFSSDDYIGLLGDNEGEWSEYGNQDETVEVGIGRFPIRTVSDANVLLDKIKTYEDVSKADNGKWRKVITYVGDDGDSNGHMRQADAFANQVERLYNKYDSRKIYLDSYIQVSGSDGEKSPAASDAITRAIQDGTLLISYSGHGGEVGWTQEGILDVPMIEGWTNEKKMPFFVTATCEYGRYDDPERQSAAEISFNRAKGGAIGLLTTTRPVYASSNGALGSAFYDHAFKRLSNGQMPTFGDIVRNTKNESISGISNRNFSLLGDPSMKLAYPEEDIKVTKINQQFVSELDTISALQKVTIEGEIQNYIGKKDSLFNGDIIVTLFDKVNEISTLGNESSYLFDYKSFENKLFEGKVAVVNGSFVAEFIVPKDIRYDYGQGRISTYAISKDNKMTASGTFEQFIIGGGSASLIDTIPPIIQVFLGDSTFKSGRITGSNPVFYAKLYDENGLNVSNSGIGHEMTLVVDNNFKNVFVLNNYYQAEENNYQKGEIEYDLSFLPEGWHTLSFKAWDVNNNSTVETLDFYVGNGINTNVYPMPVTDYSVLEISHAFADQAAQLHIEFYSQNGLLISTFDKNYAEAPAVLEPLYLDDVGVSGNINLTFMVIKTTIFYPEINQTKTDTTKVVFAQ